MQGVQAKTYLTERISHNKTCWTDQYMDLFEVLSRYTEL
jgi:hypothetical protein